MLFNLVPGNEVAVMPAIGADPSDVLEIAQILHCGPIITQLTDGRLFATAGGRGLNNPNCIETARKAHRDALKRQKSVEADTPTSGQG